jgi:hypothetical protein
LERGDPDFDGVARVSGDELRTRALLGQAVREALAGFVGPLSSLEGGGLWRTLPGAVTDPEELARELDAMIAAAQALAAATGDPAERLAHHLAADRCHGVRLRCMEAALRTLEGEPARAALRRGAADPHPEVAVSAALRLGRAGLPVLEAHLGAPELPSALRLQALQAIGGDNEAALIQLLSVGDPQLRRRAAVGLGQRGGLGEVGPLRAVCEEVLAPAALKREAREAIAAIQARCGGEAGALSLSDLSSDGAGALSLAREAGALSLPDRDERG